MTANDLVHQAAAAHLAGRTAPAAGVPVTVTERLQGRIVNGLGNGHPAPRPAPPAAQPPQAPPAVDLIARGKGSTIAKVRRLAVRAETAMTALRQVLAETEQAEREAAERAQARAQAEARLKAAREQLEAAQAQLAALTGTPTRKARRATGDKLPPTVRDNCGTTRGYAAHRTAGEVTCPACRRAATADVAARKARAAQRPA